MASSRSDDGGHIAPDQQLVLADMQKQLARYEEALATMAGTQPEAEDDFIDLRELWNMLVRRRWTIIITAAVIVVVTMIATAMMTPIFRATTVVQIETDSGNVLDFEGVTAEESNSSRDFYNTQYQLLQSRALARRVIDQLGLEGAPVEEKEPGTLEALVADLKSLFASEEPSPEEILPPNLEGSFLRNLTVEPVSGSRLVRLHYESPNREQAALIVNTIASAYVDMNLERRFEASTYAKSFLEDRIKQVRADLEDSELVMVEYTQARGIINQEDKQQILIEKMGAMNSAQVAIESERIKAESQYQEMLTASPDSLAEALDSSTIDGLKGRRTELQTEYQELLNIYKPEYPKMEQLQLQIAQVDAEINREFVNIRDGIKIKYQAKLREEAKLAESIANYRDEILELNANSTDFTTLKREVDTNRELYDGLLQRMKEVGVAAGVTNNNISVVDKAQIPRGTHKPKPLLNMMLALVLGSFAGAALAFLFEMLDDTVKSAGDLEKLAQKPVLGVIPKLSGNDVPQGDAAALQSFLEPTSAMAEAHRSMRTALMFSTADGAPKVLHFTSVAASEGKTTTAVNTAITFAQTGSQVLLIDGDLRNPSLHKVFARPNDNGLTNYLTGEAEPARLTQATGIEKLFVMTSGPVPPNPAELLHGSRMLDLITLAGKRFDYVVIDGPPLLGLADALLLADAADATLMVAAAGQARNGGVEAGLKRLNHSRANVLGAVLTKFDLNKSSYGYGDDYGYAYSYSYSADDERKSALSCPVIPDLLYLALDFFREPRRFDHLRQPGQTLPPGVGELLAAPTRCLSDEQLASTATTLNASEQDCRDCVPFFIKQLMLEVPGDYYRVLGLERGAAQSQVKEHYFYLMRLFHPDRDVHNEGWDDLYAPRINEAYNTLRNDGKRASYDATLPPLDDVNPADFSWVEDQALPPPQMPPLPIAARSTAPGFLRSPWLYAVLAVCSVLVLFSVLLKSNQTTQLTVTQLDNAVGNIEPTQLAVTGGGDPALPSDYEEPEPALGVADEPQSGSASQADIEALVRARIDNATVAVLGRPQPISKPKPKPKPKPRAKAKPQLAPVAEQEAKAQVNVRLEPKSEIQADPEPLAAAVVASAAPIKAAAVEAPVAPVQAPVARQVMPAQISNAEVEALLLQFATAYEAGNAARFALFFAEDAQTTDGRGRSEIQRVYAEFFAETRVQQFRIDELRLKRSDTLERECSALVSISTEPASGGKLSLVEADIRFGIGRDAAGAVQIERMHY